MPEVTLVEAVNLALGRAMEDDPDVVVLGEDVGVNGGVFRATVGLQKRFGAERVLDTPLAELLISGLCVGMAAQGLKPVGEIQFMGFIYPCLDQLVNHASRMRNRTRGRLTCPMVLRTPHGAGIRAPEHHSESTEAMLAHIPGLRVASPLRRNAPTDFSSQRFAIPIRWCFWNQRACTARQKARCRTMAKPCR